MYDAADTDKQGEPSDTDDRNCWGRVTKLALVAGALALLAVEPVSAQSTGSAFCDTDMADTIRNLFTLIQFGGPLVGGLVALGATVTIPLIRRADTKKELKSMRVQGVLWGVIVAPLATTILQFLLTSVVAGGSSCSF
ncbi:hypothetical protein C475_19703 [Halosimplex carlsbadense 2-9-1]|uniref:Uncharacterized protein n=1 Tax=Halosimplex carlsbadense 2-9-1 TaxID=797114 RepID=M0CDY1_9EURY|nr:hypothetical protein [Halosimplex carlsbadense]ELZ20858.1 hypothetical protein C475_19703 [Halosimplex carlsbadense 2-9-1]